MLTRLEVFRVSRGIKPSDLAEESGYHRVHVLRVRQGKTEPSRDCIAALVSASRRLSLENVKAEDLFELTTEESGAWRTDHQQLLMAEITAYRKEREITKAILGALTQLPSHRWWDYLDATPNGVSEAMARALIVDGRRLLRTRPADAERLLETAARVAEQSTVTEEEFRAFLIGRAWVEHANALRQLGKYAEALPSIGNAERHTEGVPLCTHELARAWFVRGTVLFKMDGLDESLHYLRLSINLFAAVGDQLRVARVRLVEGNVLFEQRKADAARSRWLATLPIFEASRDRHSTAMVWLNLGWADLELGRPEEAKAWLEKALTAFMRLRSDADVIRVRWPIALTEGRHGDWKSGIRQLLHERDAFEAIALFTEAGMVSFDIAELMLLHGWRIGEALRTCARLVDLFKRAGARQEIVRVVAHLWHAANRRVADAALVRKIRDEVRRAERDATYRFAPEQLA